MELKKVSYMIVGMVESGFAQARSSGFPTANLTLSEPLTIDEGIYCALVAVAGIAESLPSVVFYGVPHALPNVTEPRFEVHILESQADLYGKEISVELTVFIRENRKFDTAEELQKAIEGDIEIAREYFRSSFRSRPSTG